MTAPTSTSGATRHRARLALVAVVLLAGAGVGGYLLLRPAAPPLPAIDLRDADPEVAAAINAAINAVKAHPRSGEAWGKLGMVLRAHDFETQSVEALRAAEKFDSEDPRWPYLQGLTLVLLDPDAGLACLERAAAKSSKAQPEPRLRLAEVFLDRGQVAEAEEAAKPVAERDPTDPRAAIVLARAAAERGDWQAVLARTETARNHPAARRRSALLRAEACRRLDRPVDAEEAARYAAELPEDTPWEDRFVADLETLRVGGEIALAKATAALEAGDPRAIALIEQVVAKSQDPTRARILLAMAYNTSGDPAAARAILDKVLQADPGAVEGWFQLGYAQFLSRDPKAEESFERVVSLKPDHARAYHFLGEARRLRGDRKGAEAAYEAALRCRPNYEPSRKALAQLRGGK